jgi:transcriptional regulator with XRE-family HTH domain
MLDAMAQRTTTSRRRAADQSSRIGAEIRLARATSGMTARQVARRAGVSPSTYARIEAGGPGVAIGTLCAVAEAVGLDIVLRAFDGRRPSLRDTGQLRVAEALLPRLHGTWQPEVELLVGDHGESVDLVLFGPSEIIAVEIERLIVDFQDQYRRGDRKRAMLAALHQRPVRLVMAVEDRRRNRDAVDRHITIVRTALTAGSRHILGSLSAGRPLGADGLLWVRPGRPNRPK